MSCSLDEAGRLRRLAAAIECELIDGRDERREALQELLLHITTKTQNVPAYKVYLGIFNREANNPVLTDEYWTGRAEQQAADAFALLEGQFAQTAKTGLLDGLAKLLDLCLLAGDLKRFRGFLRHAGLGVLSGPSTPQLLALETRAVRAQLIGNLFTGSGFALLPTSPLCLAFAAIAEGDFSAAFARLKSFDAGVFPEALAGLMTAGEFAAIVALTFLGSNQPRSEISTGNFRVFDFETSDVPGAAAARDVAALLDVYARGDFPQCVQTLQAFNVKLQDPAVQLIWPDLRLKISDRLIKDHVAAHSTVAFASLARIFGPDVAARVQSLIEAGELADFRIDAENSAVVLAAASAPSVPEIPPSLLDVETEITWSLYAKIARSRVVPELQGKRLRVDAEDASDERNDL